MKFSFVLSILKKLEIKLSIRRSKIKFLKLKNTSNHSKFISILAGMSLLSIKSTTSIDGITLDTKTIQICFVDLQIGNI